jgi:hypothetical protein
MNPSAQRNLVRTAGALLGLGLALLLLLASRPGAASTPAAAWLRVAVSPAGELEIEPAPPRPLLDVRGLRPGGPAAAAGFSIRNQTGQGLELALEADADSTALNSLLRVSLRSGGRALADGTLEDLTLRPIRLRLGSGERAPLRLRAWLPADVLDGYAGTRVEVALNPVVRPSGGAP